MTKADKWHLALGLATAAIATAALFRPVPLLAAAIVVGMGDLYLLAVLIEVALRGSGGRREGKGYCLFDLPERTWGLVQMFLLVWIALAGFASMYMKSRSIVHVVSDLAPNQLCPETGPCFATLNTVPPTVLTEKSDALYYSAVTLGTLGYGDYLPLTQSARRLVIWQLVTAVLLLIGAVPLLVARLASFEEPEGPARHP